MVSIHSPKDEFYRLAAEAISFPSPLFVEEDHGTAPCYPGSKPGILLYDSSPIFFGFVSRIRPATSGFKSRMLGARCVSRSLPHNPSMPYLIFRTFQPVPHFPGSQCLVFEAYAIVIYFVLLDVLSHLLIATLTSLHHNEIK